MIKDVLALLASVYGFEAVDQDITDKKMRLLGRVDLSDSNKKYNWHQFLYHLLQESEKQSVWTIDLSLKLLLRDGQMVRGWRFIFQAEHLEEVADTLSQVIRSAPRVVPEVMEQLMPVSPNRYSGRSRGGRVSTTMGSDVPPGMR